MNQLYQHKETKIIYYILGYVAPADNANDNIVVFVQVGEINTIDICRYDINKKFNKVRLICRLKKVKG